MFLRKFMIVLLVVGFAHCAAAVELSQSDAAQLRQAEQAHQSGDQNRALNLIEPLREKYPDNADMPRLMAHCYYELGRYDEARDAALEAISLGRLSSDMLTRLVQIDRKRGDDIAAINAVRLLTVLNADDRTWRILYADLLAATGDVVEAQAVYERALESEPARGDLWARLGNVQMRQGHHERAVASFETAWQLGERNTSIAQVLTGLYQRIDDTPAALAWIERTLAMQSEPDPELRLQQARLLYAIDEHKRAREVASDITAAQAVGGQASLLLGQIAMDAEDADAAIEHWRAAHEAGVEDMALLDALARLHFNRKQYADAAHFLTQYVRQATDDADAQALLARTWLLAGDAKAARRQVRQYLERFGMDKSIAPLIRELAAALADTGSTPPSG